MSIRRLDGGSLLVDDALFDCGVGVVVSVAFGGPPLTHVRRIILTGWDPDVCGPGLNALPARVSVIDANVQPGTRLALARGSATALGHGARLAWLIEHPVHGAVLHTSVDDALDPAAVERLSEVRGPIAVGRKLSVLLRAQLSAGGIATRPLPAHRRVLITGGSRSGKSAFAEDLLSGADKVTYVAAGPALDAADGEWADRIRQHRERRPSAWQTLETLDVAGSFALGGAFLVDGLGTWLTGVIDRSGGWDSPDVARAAVAFETANLLAGYEQCEGTAVVVTDEVGSGVVPAHASGRLFRDELGRLNAAVAAASDEVWLVTAGIGSRLR